MKQTILKDILDFPSSLIDTIDEQVFGEKTLKIAITGLSQSGKSVFITSLIDQLLHQNNLLSITHVKSAFKVRLQAPLHHIKRFDYYTFIAELKREHKWPSGTEDITHTRLEFESKSTFSFLPNKTFCIELIDYPGEWLLDLNLLHVSYEEYSKKMLEYLEGIEDEKVVRFLQSLDSLTQTSYGEAYEMQIHDEFRKLLIHLKQEHYSQLTPGRFIIPSDLRNDPLLVFAPLRAHSTPMCDVFKMRYNRYVNEVVKDIHLKHFQGFERQIVLVDVVEALENSYACYSDMKQALKSMLGLYEHKNKNFLRQWFSPTINKVLFVATKADQVPASDHANFAQLLEELVKEIRKDMDIAHIETDTQIVASLLCTTSIEKKYEGKTLSFVRGRLAEDGEIHDVYAGEMPKHFASKEEYNAKVYDYKAFLPPEKNYTDAQSLSHINMDKLINKVLGDLL